MKEFLRKLVCRENIVALVVITVAVLSAFGVPQRFGIPSDNIALLLLGFLGVDALLEKLGYLDRIEKTLKALESPPAGAFLKVKDRRPPLEKRLEHAREIWISGKALSAITTSQYGLLEDKLRDGCSIRVLAIDPDSPAARVASKSSPTMPDPDMYAAQIRASLSLLDQLKNVRADSTGPGRRKRGTIERRTLDFVPSVSLLAVNPGRADGQLSVELYPYQGAVAGRPAFMLTAERDRRWYDYFVQQFKAMWKDAEGPGAGPYHPRRSAWQDRTVPRKRVSWVGSPAPAAYSPDSGAASLGRDGATDVSRHLPGARRARTEPERPSGDRVMVWTRSSLC